jgi:hypothetical protein
MGLIDEFEQAQESLRGPGYRSWYDLVTLEMSEEQREALDQALAHPKFTAKAISQVLTKWGYDVNPDKVSRHRRKLSHG